MLARSNHGIISKFGSLGVVLKHIYENTSHDIIWYLLVGYNDRHRWNTCRLPTCCSFMFFSFSSTTALFLSSRHFSTVGNLNHSLVHEVRRVAFHGYWQRRGYGRMFVSNLDYQAGWRPQPFIVRIELLVEMNVVHVAKFLQQCC